MSNKKEIPIYKRKLIWIVGIIIVLVFAMVFLGGGNKVDKRSKVSIQAAPPSVADASKSTNHKTTAKYKEEIVKYSNKQADEAQKKRGVFVQPVTNEPKAKSLVNENKDLLLASNKQQKQKTKIITKVIIDKTKEQEIERLKEMLAIEKNKTIQEKEKTKRSFLQQEQQRQNAINSYNKQKVQTEELYVDKAFNAYAKNFNSTLERSAPSFTVVSVQKNKQDKVDSTKDKKTTAKQKIKPISIVHPGDMLYVRNLISINTDYSSPGVVQAEVISSDKKINKSILFGNFKLNQDTLILEFNRMILPDKKSVSIKGYAINEKDYSTSVRSDYNSHYLRNWSLYIAGKFVEGLGKVAQLKTQQGTAVAYDSQGNPIGNTTGTYKFNPTDEAIMALGDIATGVSGKLKKNLDIPATVTLDRGSTFGVVIMDASNK